MITKKIEEIFNVKPGKEKEKAVVATFQLPTAGKGKQVLGLTIGNLQGYVEAEDGVFSIQFDSNTCLIADIQAQGVTLLDEVPVETIDKQAVSEDKKRGRPPVGKTTNK